MHPIIGLVFLFLSANSSPTSVKNLLTEDADYRLPAATVVEPTKYTIELTFPDAAFSAVDTDFQGSATIDFKVNSDITEIKLHLSKEYITITKLTVTDKELDATKYTIDETTEILTIPTTDLDIKKDQSYQLVITYTGKISTTDNYGIFKTSYVNADKATVYLLATQFQGTYARRAFPCFDEPAFKATFELSVTYPATKNLGVLFNTEQAGAPAESVDKTTYTVGFKATPVMSSYLFALAISDFSSTKGAAVVGDTVAYSVWSRDALATSRADAVDLGPKILQVLNEYTGYKYGAEIPKLDQIALPQIPVGAMENWGLVTYTETALLWNTADSSTSSKQFLTINMAHELAHQWFGNLITCEWWSDAFLNEGFASYFDHFITNQLQPTWGVDKQFVLNNLQPILESDASEGTQALESDTYTPQQVKDKFGQITYKKGASIIRMLNYILGEANFKAGVQDYFKTAEYIHSTITPTKLWETLQKQVKPEISVLPDGVTLTNVMENWIEKPGYPLLRVSMDGTNLKIKQESFLTTETGKDNKWYVPISYAEVATKFENPQTVAWLTPVAPEISLPFETAFDWIVLNPLQTGYYRVSYDASLLAKINTALNVEGFSGIVDVNRANIVDDLFALARTGEHSFSDVLKGLAFLKNDVSYYPWVPAFKGFSYMLQRIPEGNEIRTLFQQDILTLSDKFYKTVVFGDIKEDDQIYTLTQALALTWACELGLEDCVTKVQAAFTEYKSDPTKLNKNLKNLVLCNALKASADVADYDLVLKSYTDTESSTDKIIILKSLGCSNSEDKLKELLTETIKVDSTIRSQDALTAFTGVAGGSQKGAGIALDFLVANFPAILVKIPSTAVRTALINGIAEKLTTSAQLAKLTVLIVSTGFPEELQADAVKAGLQAEANIKWITTHEADLQKYYDVTPITTTKKPGGAATAHMSIGLLLVVGIFSLFGRLAI